MSVFFNSEISDFKQNVGVSLDDMQLLMSNVKKDTVINSEEYDAEELRKVIDQELSKEYSSVNIIDWSKYHPDDIIAALKREKKYDDIEISSGDIELPRDVKKHVDSSPVYLLEDNNYGGELSNNNVKSESDDVDMDFLRNIRFTEEDELSGGLSKQNTQEYPDL